MPASSQTLLPRAFNFGSWCHYNDAKQLIASGQRYGDGPDDWEQGAHAPFDLPPMAPWHYLHDDDPNVRAAAAALIRNIMRCLRLTYSC
jgi:hypothetical protein